MCEPLKEKIRVISALKRMMQQHEEKIEEFTNILNNNEFPYMTRRYYLQRIEDEYEAIMILEERLSDVV